MGRAEESFRQLLFDMWFAFYRRDSWNDSSGFEHVFVGESRDGRTSGFHNWIQFYIEESRNRLDYRGYIFPESPRPEVPP